MAVAVQKLPLVATTRFVIRQKAAFRAALKTPAVRRIIRLNNLHTAYDSRPPEMNQQTKCLSLASGVLRTLLGEAMV